MIADALDDYAARPASVLAPTHAVIAWFLSFVIGCAGAWVLFPIPVLLGTAPFWTYPSGIAGGSWADMATALSGYDAFVRDAWRWPLFHTFSLGGSAGANVVFTDSIPVVALLGRMLFRITGQVIPLFGAWSGLCLVGMALASTGLVRALGARGVPAAIAAAIIGVSMPALLARWGHLSLMAQGLLPLALIIYVKLYAEKQLSGAYVFACLSALCLASLLVHPYLFFMVTAVAAAALLQAASDRRLSRPAAAVILGALAMVLGICILAMGHLAGDGTISAAGFGVFSTNLLSPIMPQVSGIIPGALPEIMDATGGQYEGFVYLGAGLLLLALISYGSLRCTLASRVRRHPFLAAVLIGFTALALSNDIYAGQLHLLAVPMPDSLLRAAGVVRASGRFAWLGLYLVAALAIVAVNQRPKAGLILLLAAGLQWADADMLRRMVRQSVSHPSAAVLDTSAWRAVLPGLDHVVVDPPFLCLRDGPEVDWRMQAAMQVQLMASQSGTATNTVYAARTRPDCVIPRLEGRSLLVRLRAAGPEIDPALTCRSSSRMTVCSAALGPDVLATLLRVSGDP